MEPTITDAAPTQRPLRSRKARAILAGGLVLGLGAAVTYATWSDSEWGAGTFASGKFNLEGSINGTSYTEHPTADDAAALTFGAPALNLRPGQSVASPFSIRLDDETTVAADVTISAGASGAAATDLSYGIVSIPAAATCSTASTGTVVVPAGTALGSATGAVGFALAPGADDAAGEAANLCIIVTAADDLAQGATANATWTFTAETD